MAVVPDMVEPFVAPSSTRHQVLMAHLAMALASSSFGVMSVLGSLALSTGVDPLVFVLYRDLLACPLLVCVTVYRRGWSVPRNRRDTVQFIMIGLSGIFGNQIFYFLGLNFTSADLTSMYQPVAPLLTAVFAVYPWRYEAPSCTKAIGVLVGCCGVMLMIMPSMSSSRSSSGAHYLIGNLFLLISEISSSVYFLFQKPLFARYTPEMITTGAYIVSASLMLLTVGPFVCIGVLDWRLRTIGDIGVLLYASIVCSSVSYQLMTWANQHLDATITNFYGILQPSVTGVLAYFALGELFTWLDILATMIVFLGLAIVSFTNRASVAVSANASPQSDCDVVAS